MKHTNGKPFKTVGLSAYGLLATGLLLILLSVIGEKELHWSAWITAFIRDIGLLLAAVIAGTILHEKLLRDEMLKELVDELDGRLEKRIPTVTNIADTTANTAHELFCKHPPEMTGLRLLDGTRRNFSGYYSWVIEQKSQELFFAGRSVLHRIDADIRSRTNSSAEEVLFRRLRESSKINILFLDPRIEILDRLAKEEGQKPENLLGDLAVSIGICYRLFDLLEKNAGTLKSTAELTIRIYNRVPYFAYHKQDDEVIVGFYFLSNKGYSSAAYEVVDEKTKQVFGDHFVTIHSDSAEDYLVDFNGARGRPDFNASLFNELQDYLSKRLGAEKTAELINRKK